MPLRATVADLCSEKPSGTVTPTWLLVLIEQLPDDSATAASMQGGRSYRGWGLDRHMTADLWDMQAIQLHGGSKKGKPARYPRPGGKKAGTSLGSLMPPRRRNPKGSR